MTTTHRPRKLFAIEWRLGDPTRRWDWRRYRRYTTAKRRDQAFAALTKNPRIFEYRMPATGAASIA